MRSVVIGTGPAGITAAETLRRLDPYGSVVALSTEPYAPYSPPALADHLLHGRTDSLYWKGTDVCARLGIQERRATTVSGLDVDAHEVALESGERVGYEGLVIASGSRLHAPLDGAGLPGVLDFKSLQMTEHLAQRIRTHEARTALVVGNGFIGVELSMLLANMGVDVTLIGRRTWLMPRVLDPVTSTVVERSLTAAGVTLRLGVEASAFVGETTARGVRFVDGTEATADLVVAATGVKPHVEFLAGSPIVAEWGIHVDDRMRTSVPNVVAAGDVAEAADWLTGQRYVHAIFQNAVTQGPVAAANLLGAEVHYDGAEAMNSLKHLGVPVVAVGTTDTPDEVLRWRDDTRIRSVYLRDGRIIGAQLAGDVRAIGIYRSLMLRRADVSHFGERLVEPGFGVSDVVFDALPVG